MAGCGGVLLVTDVAMLPASVVLWALQTFGDKAAGGKAMAVVTNASYLAPGSYRHLGLATASLEVVISLVENPGHHTKAWLSEIVHVLKPGGVLWLQEPFACQDVAEAEQQRLSDAPVQTQAVLERNLLLAGFVDVETAECVSGVGLAQSYSTSATGSEHGPLLKPVAVRVLKPTWETGSSFGLKKKATLEQESTLVSLGDTLRLSTEDVNDTSLPLANTWKATCVDDDGDEFVDEDALLDEDDLKRPVLPGADDCEVEKAGKKACKNCTCGRAELEEKTPLTAAQLNNPQSACGNCGLGDAFRCGGCPYRGLPAFKLGEKISLPGSLLVADA
ncbi:hypothetical protein BDL97_02G171600 [Sphagnum fallax]|nr:hypothetical protein BDL97_02G171600 [Sphagnum fallax]